MHYDIRPRSFGQIAATADALAEVWPKIVIAFTPLTVNELPSRLWHLGALRKRLAEILVSTPELLADIAATKTIYTPTDDEKERMQAHALRGEEAEIDAITTAVMSRGGVEETGIERARRVFALVEQIERRLMYLTRINTPDNIPPHFAKRGPLPPETLRLMTATERAFRADRELMQHGPDADDAAPASFTVRVPGLGAYPIPTGVVYVASLNTIPIFKIELPASTHFVPFGRNDAIVIGGDSYLIEVEPT